MTKKKIVLLDGNSLAYRAFFALPLLTNDMESIQMQYMVLQ